MIFFALMCFYQKLILVNSGDLDGNTIMSAPFAPQDIAVRIIGGEITDIVHYPFTVSVQRRYFSSHFCGGSYVAPRFVLSAAHCMVRKAFGSKWTVQNPRLFYAIAGSTKVYYPDLSSTQMELIDRTLPHPEFRFADMQNDIGLFRLRNPFRLNPYVQFVLLPSAMNVPETHYGHCTVVGWGRHIPDSNKGSGTLLRHVNISLIPVEQCPFPDLLKDRQLCAGEEKGGRDACQGDSGGPLLCNNIQVGIVSWGIGCAEPGLPGVYCRVDHYLDWINLTTIKNGLTSHKLNIYIIVTALLYYSVV